jgi:multiple sugar transport system substrate-binding protein
VKTKGVFSKKPVFRLFIGTLVLMSVVAVSLMAQQGIAEAATLDVWFQADAVREPGFVKVTEAFKEKYPDVEVRLTNVPGSWEDLYRKLLAAFAAGNEPDVLYGKGHWIADFAMRGMLLDLTDRLERDKAELDAHPQFFEHLRIGASYDGRIYGLPRGQYWYTLAYNVDKLAEAGIGSPPETWEELRSFAAKLSQPEKNVYGFALATYNRIDAVAVESIIDTWTRQAGGRIMTYDANGRPVYNFSTPEVKEAFDFVLENIHETKGFLPPELEPSANDMWLNGDLAMWWGHGGHISRWRAGSPDLNFLTTVMPAGKGGRLSYIANNQFWISARTKNPDIAWNYIKHFTTREMEELIAPYEGHLSLWEANWDLPIFQDPAYKGVMAQLVHPDTEPFQPHAGWEPVRAAIARALQGAVFGQTTAEVALKEAELGAQRALRDVDF